MRKLLGVKKQLNNGFTLIEFLVVLGVLIAAMGASTLFLASVLRGSNKANVVAEVKQNGQAVLDSLDRQIKNATNAEQVAVDSLPPGSSSGIKLTGPGEKVLYVACFDPVVPTANGWIGIADVAGAGLSDYVTLTNKEDLVSGVDVSQCSLEAISASGGVLGPPIVRISFVMNQGLLAPSREDFLANVKFETTISLRSYVP